MGAKTSDAGRYRELDALRGLAALSVFLSHSFGLVNDPVLLSIVRSFGMRAISDGAAAVDLFFVLSGFVLARSLFTAGIDYRTFLLRRVFRIYPAYWASLAFALVAEHFLLDRAAIAKLAEFGQIAVAGPVDWRQLLFHGFMIIPRTFDQNLINPVIWTIVIEMQVSIVFPGLIWLFLLRSRPWWSAALLAASVAVSVVVYKSEALSFLRFIPLFLYGVILARYRQRLETGLAQAGVWAIAVGYVVCIAAYCVRVYPLPGTGWKHFVTGAGAAGLIVLATRPGVFRAVLLSPVLLFFGRISYSIYLFHLPTLLVTASLVYAWTGSQVAMILAAFVAMTLVSWLNFVLVERPTHEAGRRATVRRPRAIASSC